MPICCGWLQAGKTLLPVYIGVDDLPAPRYEVESWLAREMGLQDQLVVLSAAGDDPTRHNTAGHKRCRNSALHDSGYQLIYPDYKIGYGALLAAR